MHVSCKFMLAAVVMFVVASGCANQHSSPKPAVVNKDLAQKCNRSAGKLTPTRPRDIHGDTEYYEIEDLKKAARLMRAIAEINNIDIDSIPVWASQTNEEITSIRLPARAYSPDFHNQAFLDRLNSACADEVAQEYVAILAVRRPLTIRETAELFESNIRIYELLVGGPKGYGLGGFIVRSRGENLRELRSKPYFRWLGEYSSNLKQGVSNSESSKGFYAVEAFYNDHCDHFLNQVIETGAQFKSYIGGTIKVKATPDEVELIKEFMWVKEVNALGGEFAGD